MKWEYKSAPTSVLVSANVKVLNDLGEDGWELVTSIDGIIYMKRPVDE